MKPAPLGARAFLTFALLAALIGAAQAYGLGNRFGRMGASGKGGVATPTVNTCSSGSLMNGTFDLTNTCNDIYFIGALK